jgi:hypothetical protein
MNASGLTEMRKRDNWRYIEIFRVKRIEPKLGAIFMIDEIVPAFIFSDLNEEFHVFRKYDFFLGELAFNYLQELDYFRQFVGIVHICFSNHSGSGVTNKIAVSFGMIVYRPVLWEIPGPVKTIGVDSADHRASSSRRISA